MIEPRKNPLFNKKIKQIEPDGFKAPHVTGRQETTDKRELLRLFRKEKAADFIGDIQPGFHRFGFSKGQFSLVDLIAALLPQLRPVHFALSTWTVAKADLGELQAMLNPAALLSARFLLDLSFQRRQPALIKHLREGFGEDAIRVTRNHAKFLLFGNDKWKVTVRTSMNLNFNPRLEDIEVKDDAELYGFVDGILADIFKQHGKRQNNKTVKELGQQFAGFTD
jgi:hypothetical protein|tara:strand:+ start:60 stop:728 length:669 start_codon:yes stop_codon:yes gene_type:complete